MALSTEQKIYVDGKAFITLSRSERDGQIITTIHITGFDANGNKGDLHEGLDIEVICDEFPTIEIDDAFDNIA